jgi:sodium/hydrogen antiporter
MLVRPKFNGSYAVDGGKPENKGCGRSPHPLFREKIMVTLLLFGIALLIAVLLSGLAERSALSIAAIFLLIGFIAGHGAIGLIQVNADNNDLFTFVEVALVTILYTDGMKIGKKDLLKVWKLPGRALLFGLPLTLFIMALLARLILSLTWLESFLVAAVLSPTDPVFTSAIVSRKEIPVRLRRLLNVESGINDGIALPIVLVMFALLGVEKLEITRWVAEILLGIAIGVTIPWAVLSLKKTKLFSISKLYSPLLGLAIALLVFSIAKLINANPFLAAFFAGVTIATVDSEVRDVFLGYGELVSELFKLGGVLLFGAMLTLNVFSEVKPSIYLYTVLVLVLARPIAIILALAGSAMNWRERLVASWFGPRGFASVVYGLLVLGSGIPRARELFLLISVVVTGSILIHSSTDGIVARWIQKREEPIEAEAVTNTDLSENGRHGEERQE